jgi:hypothetical protein
VVRVGEKACIGNFVGQSYWKKAVCKTRKDMGGNINMFLRMGDG